MRLSERFEKLVETVAAIPGVRAVGKSGGPALPESDGSDIDLFVYCSEIPELTERSRAMEDIRLLNANTQESGHWGVVDLVLLSGIETYLMYFTMDETIDSVRDILDGKLPDKLDNYYYPTGRLATLREMAVLHDADGFLASMKRRLAVYPDKLAESLLHYHIEALGNVEDLARAVTRSDALFYHFALDLALDHFLQALFALNRVYFPSRKRSLDHIERFNVKPDGCAERLLEIIRLGGTPEGIRTSYQLWQALVGDFIALSGRNQ